MKKHHRPHTTGASGFTLIELMVVIAIILVLSTIVVGGLGWYKRKAAVGKTKVLLSSIERGLEEYKHDNGFFPSGNGAAGSTEQVYIALFGDGKLEISGSTVTIKTEPDGTTDSGNTVYLDSLDPDLSGNKLNVLASGGTYVIVDAWGMEMYYKSPATMNPADDFDLWSRGPNGLGGPSSANKTHKADDIKNW